MTKPEMIAEVARQVGITKADAGRAINCTIKLITVAVRDNGRIDVTGLGVFKNVRRKETNRPNPQDRSKRVLTPARNTVTFKPAPGLKAMVNP